MTKREAAREARHAAAAVLRNADTDRLWMQYVSNGEEPHDENEDDFERFDNAFKAIADRLDAPGGPTT